MPLAHAFLETRSGSKPVRIVSLPKANIRMHRFSEFICIILVQINFHLCFGATRLQGRAGYNTRRKGHLR